MHIRQFIAFKILAIAFLFTIPVIAALPASAEKYASIVIDADTNEVLHARHADAPRYPASLTKVMTLYMTFDALKTGELTLNEKLPVSRRAAGQAPSSLRLKTGSTITVHDAIDALVTKSANDVACVLAERLGGSEARFARLMTAKARSLGMKSTRFRNASGLPDTRQLTTARDMAILAEAILAEHSDYYHFFSKTRFRWGSKTYKNHNALLDSVEGVDGIKTGYTRASGFNLMASAKRDGRRVITVMLGGRTAKSRNTHVAELIEAAYDSIEAADKANPERLTLIAFQKLQTPSNPNAAAVPMLNGKPFGVIAQGDADLAPPTIASMSVESAKPVLRQRTATPVAQTSKPATSVIASGSAPTMSVSEYEARQLSK